MTSNTGFKVTVLSKANIIQKGAFFNVMLSTADHLLT